MEPASLQFNELRTIVSGLGRSMLFGVVPGQPAQTVVTETMQLSMSLVRSEELTNASFVGADGFSAVLFPGGFAPYGGTSGATQLEFVTLTINTHAAESDEQPSSVLSAVSFADGSGTRSRHLLL